jgi:hypothetical protein
MIAAPTPRALRRAQRAVHLLGAIVLFVYLYAPSAPLEDVVRFAVFPALALTGVAMWQAARIRRAIRAARGTVRKTPDTRPMGRKDRE